MLCTQKLTLAIAGRILCADLDLRLAAGENWVILGANGSGKTTLLHHLAGLRTPDIGRVELEQRELHEWAHRARARKIGVLFQDPESVFPATVIETVLTGRHPYRERWQWESTHDRHAAEAALAAVDLSEFAQRPMETLSGGERRRVEIAALLAQDAPVCLMDEPTNHLDLRHQVRIMARLAQRAHQPGHLNVFVLHDINLAIRFGTHAILMFDNGECRHGAASMMLRRNMLEELYHTRLREIRDTNGSYLMPE